MVASPEFVWLSGTSGTGFAMHAGQHPRLQISPWPCMCALAPGPSCAQLWTPTLGTDAAASS